MWMVRFSFPHVWLKKVMSDWLPSLAVLVIFLCCTLKGFILLFLNIYLGRQRPGNYLKGRKINLITLNLRRHVGYLHYMSGRDASARKRKERWNAGINVPMQRHCLCGSCLVECWCMGHHCSPDWHLLCKLL